MSLPLSSEETERYTELIDAILATADLATISRKKVREGLAQGLGGKDLSGQKAAIKALIEQRFDVLTQNQAAADTPPDTYEHSADVKSEIESNGLNGHRNGLKHENADEDEADGEIQVSIDTSQPAKKKQKRSSSSVEDEDARLAAELQAQEDRVARGRTTRGGNNKVAKPKSKKPKTPKKKSATKVKAGDDSDLETEDSGTTKKRKAGGGFQKEFNLSFQLADVVGADRMSRPQVVKKLWEHIKANDLQDPSDKRQIVCDEKLQATFKVARVDMFQMNKLLGNHLYPIEEQEQE